MSQLAAVVRIETVSKGIGEIAEMMEGMMGKDTDQAKAMRNWQSELDTAASEVRNLSTAPNNHLTGN